MITYILLETTVHDIYIYYTYCHKYTGNKSVGRCIHSPWNVFIYSLDSTHHTCRRLIDKNRCMCVRVDVVGQAATWLYVPLKPNLLPCRPPFTDHSIRMIPVAEYVSFYL